MFPDSNFVTYLLNGIQYGFCIGCHSSSNLRSAASNMKGALDHATVVEKYLHEERAAGRIVSVLSEYHSNMHVSRFGVIPKRHQPGEWRLIVDLSAPEGRSVNDFINASLCSLMYASVDDVADFVLTAGQGTLLANWTLSMPTGIYLSILWIGISWGCDGMMMLSLTHAFHLV